MGGVQSELREEHSVFEVANVVNEERQVCAQVVDDKTVGRGEADVDVKTELAFVVRVLVVRCLSRSLCISINPLPSREK